uniref:Transcriptional regulator, Fis family n=1 Tax=Solibacter usitatus (strain Ellin6076) TaxID=234267 RepID=Q026V1_SOLUE
MLTNSSQIVLITGGTGGIGQAIAVRMAKLGATTIVVGRDQARGEAAKAEIRTQSGNRSVELMLADLSSQGDIRRLAGEFMARYGRLDVLVNNVGGLYGKRWETVDGIECTLALNHLCPFLLTHLLLPVLRAGAPSRIVNINSEGHRAAKSVNFGDFDAARWKRGFLIYSQSKLANLLFTFEMARRLSPSEITVNAVHPGIVDTQLFRRFIEERFTLIGGVLSKAAAFVARKVAYRISHFDTVETAAECPVYLASSSEVAGITGKYFGLNKKIVETSAASLDADLSREVWRMSAEMVGLSGNEASQVQRRFA